MITFDSTANKDEPFHYAATLSRQELKLTLPLRIKLHKSLQRYAWCKGVSTVGTQYLSIWLLINRSVSVKCSINIATREFVRLQACNSSVKASVQQLQFSLCE
jgi:hypothetical protein